MILQPMQTVQNKNLFTHFCTGKHSWKQQNVTWRVGTSKEQHFSFQLDYICTRVVVQLFFLVAGAGQHVSITLNVTMLYR